MVDRLLQEADGAIPERKTGPARVPGFEPGAQAVGVITQWRDRAAIGLEVVGEVIDGYDRPQGAAGAGQGPVTVATWRLVRQGFAEEKGVGQSVGHHGEGDLRAIGAEHPPHLGGVERLAQIGTGSVALEGSRAQRDGRIVGGTVTVFLVWIGRSAAFAAPALRALT